MSSNLFFVFLSSIGSDLAYLCEVELNRLVFLSANIDKDLHAHYSHIVIRGLASFENLLHDVVPLLGDLEVLASIRQGVQQGLCGKLSTLDQARVSGDVVDESKDDAVFEVIAQILGGKFFTDES